MNKKQRNERAKKANKAMRDKYGSEWLSNNCRKAANARWKKKEILEDTYNV